MSEIKLPDEFLNRISDMLGDETDSFIASYKDSHIMSLRINPLKKDMGNEKFAEFTEGLTEGIPWEESGFYYDETFEPGRHPLHNCGAYYIQEASAMAPVSCLNIFPGAKVLDLCAAPGGKSTQIAGKLSAESILVSNEPVPKRAKILSENIERMGVKNAVVVSGNPQDLKHSFEGFFDLILVDAPCSGEGMFRKHPEAIEEWSKENVLMCAARQEEILEAAYDMLAAGGQLVYSTCTFSTQENEENILAFLKRHEDMSGDIISDVLKSVAEKPTAKGLEAFKDSLVVKNAENFMCRLYPHKLKGEGHFLAVLKKAGESYGYGGRLQKSSRLGKNEKELLAEFCEETLVSNDFINSDRFLTFGTNLYVMPENMPDMSGVKVLRAGLLIGSFEKKRFEPSHALAMILSRQQVKKSVELSESEAQQYLKGMTINCAADVKGWVLLTHCGYPLGWGKASGGVIKNHYPKGLRLS